MARHPSARTLMHLYDGELGPAEAAEVESHASSCPRCRAWLDDLASVGAVVRGDVVPSHPPARARSRRRSANWLPRPWYERAVPPLAAVGALAIVMSLVIANTPDNDGDVALGPGSPVQSVRLPAVPPPDESRPAGIGTTSPTDGDGPTGSAGPPGSTLPRTPSGAGPTGAAESVVPTDPEADPVVVAVLVPGGQSGEAEAVHAVAVALAQANAAGGIDGAPLELVAADANDPGAADALVDLDVDVLVGGYGASDEAWRTLDEAAVPWFGPAEVAPAAVDNVVPIEPPHAAAGALVAEALRSRDLGDVAAIIGPGPEADLADGLETATKVTTVPRGSGTACRAALDSAGKSGAPVLALALAPEEVGGCLNAMTPADAFSQVVIPSTGVDEIAEGLPEGVGVAAALGAPAPDADRPGAARFRAATGIEHDYRALVTYAAAELAVSALRNDRESPLKGFAAAGIYRSDLLTLNPAASPPNSAVQVVDLVRGGPGPPPSKP